ncbi:peroxiredoxin [Pseudohongiella nitratireducens]|uniref:Peroxiredoxin n=1 Tax=Pseudohongiella nitratireducens TaxID=1768907 RepID=A0A916VJ06_9GAMM|nr:OsmC family protein [Pseudohongiella nitratireducens]MDF1622267.1 OsmC family protein [Pseudohongiella nitratireducens]GFZ76046.1 peroxiredoxin [Pseudohongiella nitratireducens]|tara:strand:+ start:2308 stop:2727 length:420 start_codon:yes stop_codon:yes gene_type:complete
MKATVRWVNNAMFLGESGSGHTVVMDGPEDSGGRNLGVRPMEMLLLGTGGCSSFDVVNILRKSRQDIVDCVVDMEATRADGVPAVFESIHMHFKVTGNNLSEKQVERAVHLSADKYCSASIMLGEAGVKVTHSFEIVTP